MKWGGEGAGSTRGRSDSITSNFTLPYSLSCFYLEMPLVCGRPSTRSHKYAPNVPAWKKIRRALEYISLWHYAKDRELFLVAFILEINLFFTGVQELICKSQQAEWTPHAPTRPSVSICISWIQSARHSWLWKLSEQYANKFRMWGALSVCCVGAGTVGVRGDQVAERSLQRLLRGNQMVHFSHSSTAITSFRRTFSWR